MVCRFILIVILAAGGLCGCSSLPHGPRAADKAASVDAALSYARAVWDMIPDGAQAGAGAQSGMRDALAEVLEELEDDRPLRSWKGTVPVDGWQVTFASSRDGWAVLDPSRFDEVESIPAGQKFKDIKRPAVQDGLGLPVVLSQEYREEKASTDTRLFPLNGRHLPATLTAEFTGPRAVRLTFHHTRNVQKARVKGRERALAYDLTTPLMRCMDAGFLGKFAMPGLFKPEEYLKESGIYVPELFDPKKIPVVFVHGLDSAPHIWEVAMNELLADPVLRQNYQIWYFLYPTGLPIHGSAARLRASLNAARRHYDPQDKLPALDRMILVGHSMGGLISRMQVIDSGEEFYRALFTRPLSALKLSAESREMIRKVLYFRRQPFIERVIFIATPHRGSQIADFRIVQFLAGLIERAVFVNKLFEDIMNNAQSAINPDLHQFRDLGGRSVQNLSPRHPLLGALNRLRIQVPFHSIIAATSLLPPVEDSSDRFVPWRSAHLPGAASELLVPGWHSCTTNQEVTAEISRILREGLKR